MPVVQEQAKPRMAGPPAWLATIVQALTPRAVRNQLAVELISNYTTLPLYCLDAGRRVSRETYFKVIRAFDRTRLIGDIACVFIAFHTLPVSQLLAILVIAALVLLWRDGYTHPPETSAGEAAIDAMTLGAGIVAWQLFCLFDANSFAAPPVEFMTGLPFALAMVAGWRFTSRWEKVPKPSPTDAERAYRDAWRVYLLWMAGVVALIAGNTRVVVDPGFFRDFFFALGPWIPFVSGARLQSDRIGGGLFDWMMMSLFGDPQQIRNAARATHLFSKRTKTWAEFSLVTFFEGLFFATLAGEILFVPIGVLLGRIPVDDVHWFQLTVDAAVFVTLSRMWIDIKKIHEKVAAALLAESKPDATFIYSMPTEGGP